MKTPPSGSFIQVVVGDDVETHIVMKCWGGIVYSCRQDHLSIHLEEEVLTC